MRQKYVVQESTPRFRIADPRCQDPECGHYRHLRGAYEALADAFTYQADLPMETEEQVEYLYRLRARLARWLQWADSRLG